MTLYMYKKGWLCYYSAGILSLVPRPLPNFQCCIPKNVGDKARN
jgi:hypothetical protein